METASGYVLVQTTSPWVAAKVAAAARTLPGVGEATVVHGAYDVVLRVRTDASGAAGLIGSVSALPEVLRALPLKRHAGSPGISGAA